MGEKNLCNDDLSLVKMLSNATSEYDKYLVLLQREYGFSLSKSDLAEVLGVSEKTINRRLEEGKNIPKYKRTSNGKKATYIFPISEVAKFLCETQKVFG